MIRLNTINQMCIIFLPPRREYRGGVHNEVASRSVPIIIWKLVLIKQGAAEWPEFNSSSPSTPLQKKSTFPWLVIRRVELLSQLVDSSGSDSGEEARSVNHHSPHPVILIMIMIKIFITNQPNREAAGNIEIDVSSIESGSEVNLNLSYLNSIIISVVSDCYWVCILIYNILCCAVPSANNQTASRWHWGSHLLHF